MRTARTRHTRHRIAAALLAAAATLAWGAATNAWGGPAAGSDSSEASVPTMQYDSGLKQAKAKAESKIKVAVEASNQVAGMLSQPAGGKAKTAAKPAAPATAKASALHTPRTSEERHLLHREVYVYKTVGRRDPFASLLEGEFETTVGSPLLDVSSMKLVGIVWGASDKFALVEDGRGHGHVLRVGDPVINGYVVGLTKQELLVRQSSYGESQTVTIQLQRKEGSSDDR